MSVGQIVLLVLGLLGVQALAWVVVLRWLKGRLAKAITEIDQQLVAAGERVERGPEHARYRGGSGDWPGVKGNGVLALTDRRLVFRKLVGDPIEVPVADIAAVSRDKWFRGGYVGGRVHTIIETTNGDKLGFIVRDDDAWLESLRKQLPSPPPTP